MAHPGPMDGRATTLLTKALPPADAPRYLSRFAWGVLAYSLFVILLGAVVRITFSGAGCGQHWPSCNGELMQLPHTLKATIEYSHRATSGLSVLAISGLLFGAFRVHSAGHPVRRGALLAFAMILVEALIGALIVRWRLVEHDASLERVVMLPLHLTSTALLTAAITWCACFARTASPRFERLPNGVRALLLLAGLGILLVSATGAVTALGDTVYPVQQSGLAARFHEDQGASATLLQRMRGIHPFLAVAVAAYVAYTAALLSGYRGSATVKRASSLLAGCVALQVLAGVVNVWLSAPAAMQVLHLLLANFTWISLIVLAAAARQAGAGEATSAASSSGIAR